MKNIRLAANWIFISVGYPLFMPFILSVLVSECVCEGLKAFGKDLIWQLDSFKDIFGFKNFMKGREPWLKYGTHWPMQSKKSDRKKVGE